MSKKKYHRKRKQQNLLVPIGIFLIVIAVLFVAASKSTGNGESLLGIAPAAVNYAAPELSVVA